jgi:hypothetical protein
MAQNRKIWILIADVFVALSTRDRDPGILSSLASSHDCAGFPQCLGAHASAGTLAHHPIYLALAAFFLWTLRANDQPVGVAIYPLKFLPSNFPS